MLKNCKNWQNWPDRRTALIAEVGINHGGNEALAWKMILAAHENGADLVKIQTYEPQDLTLKSFTKGFKVEQGTWKKQYLWNLYKKAHTPFRWHKDAFLLARKKKINLFSTPFSKRGVDLLESFEVPLYKVSSFELTENFLRRSDELESYGIFITPPSESILNEALIADDLIGKKKENIRQLTGIPIPIKDMDPVKGLPYTHGSLPYKDFIANDDSLLVSRIKKSGGKYFFIGFPWWPVFLPKIFLSLKIIKPANIANKIISMNPN